MPRIVLDFEPPLTGAPELPADTADLVYFLSWAYSARYGGNHELSASSLVLRGEYAIDLKPLLTFADRSVDDETDAELLEQAWQDAAALATCCDAIAAALAGEDARFASILADYPALQPGVAALGASARWAAGQGARIRVTYDLEATS